MLKKPIINTVVQIGAKVVTAMIGVATTMLLVRKLGVVQYGFFTLIGSFFVFVDSLADFGTKIMGVREMSSFGKNKRRVWRQVFCLRLLMASGAFLLGLIFVFGWNSLVEIRGAAVVAMMMIWLTSVAGSLEVVWQSRLRMDMKVAGDVLYSLLFLLFIWMGWGEISLTKVYSLSLVARVFSLGLGVKLFLKLWKVDLKKIFKVSSEGLRKMFKMSWPMGLYLLIFTSYDRAVDSLMIDRMLGVEAVAWYGLAYKVYGVLIQPAYFFTASIFPIMSRRQRKGFVLEDKKKGGWSQNLFLKSIGVLGLGLVFLVPVIYWLAPGIIELLAGQGFEASVGVLRILLVALVFSYINHLNGFTLISRGGQKQMLGLGLVTLLFNLGANLWMIPRYGVMGAAMVTVATEGLSLVLVSGWLLRKK